MMHEEFLDQLLSLPRIDDELLAKCSKDGNWVAWTWFNTSEVTEVYVVSTQGGQDPIRMTETDQNTFFVSWAPDSASIIVEQDTDGDERMRLFRVYLNNPRVMHPLTVENPNYYIRGGQIDSSEQYLTFSANRDPLSGEETENTSIYRMEINSGELSALASQQAGCSTTPKLSPTEKFILYERNDLSPAGRQAWLVGTDGRYDHELINVGADKKVFCEFAYDRDSILVIAEGETHRRFGVYSIDLADVIWLIDDPARDIQFCWPLENSQQVCVVENILGRACGVIVNLETGAEQSLRLEQGSLLPLGQRHDGRLIGAHYSSTQPGQIVLFDVADLNENHWVTLAGPWQAGGIRSEDLTEVENFSWTSVDGLAIHGWLYKAKGKAIGTIAHIHGGPTYHCTDMVTPQIQFFTRMGFNVFEPNYRGSTGYGYAFQQAILEDGWGGREMDDILSGIQTLIDLGIAQVGKIGITGTSYGGYSSWWAATHFPPEVIAASAPICGMTDLVVDYETTRPDLRPYSAEMNGGTPSEIPDKYKQRSPIHYTRNIRCGLLIVQGGQDPNVTPKNVEDVKIELEKNDIPYEVLLFQDEGHGIMKRANQKVLDMKLVEFFSAAFSAVSE